MAGYDLTPERFGNRLNLRPGLPETVKAYSVTGDGNTDDYAALNEVAIKFGTTGHAYFPAGTYRVGTNLTFNCLCEFAPGATFDPDSGVTVTLAGPIRTAPGSSIVLAGTTGTVSITGPMDAGGGTFNVKAFGALGDGVTDDTAAIQRAGTAAAVAGTPLHFPAGTYVIATSVAVQGDYGVIQWVGDGDVVLDGSTSTADQLITLGGTVGSTSALTASPSRGDLTIQSSLVSSLSKRDVMLIQSTDAFGPSSVFNTKGEMAEVESVSGTTATLRTALYDGYDSATSTMRIMNAPRVDIQSITVLRNSTHDGLEIRYARDLYLRNVRVSGARRSCLDLWYCVGGVVENCQTDDAFGTDTGLQYGLAVNTCQWITVTGGTYYGGRHAIAHGGNEPVRGMTYLGVTASGDVVDASVTSVDFHDNSEFNVVEGCTFFGGITGQGRNITIRNNRFQRTSGETTINWGFAASFDYFVFSGNFFETDTVGTGVRLSYSEPNVTIGLVDISNNYGTGLTTVSISDAGEAGAAITKLKLHGNVVLAGSTNQALAIGGSGATLVISDTEIIGGTYQGSGDEAIRIRPASTSRTLRMVGTVVRNIGDVRPFGVFNVTHVTISDCRIEGNGFATSSFVQDAANVVLRDNYFYNCGANGGFSLTLSVLSASLCQDSGNVLDTCTGTFNASAGGIYIDYQTSTGRRVGRGTAAPAAGTWAVGDTVWNTAPAAAGAPGWMCTTAGTPGTWKAMANLAA